MRTALITMVMGFFLLFGSSGASAAWARQVATASAAPQRAIPTAIIVVNDDGDDGVVLPSSCSGVPGDCTLRQAIQISNDSAVVDAIRFDLTLYPDGMTIRPNAALPEITRPVVIDGVTGNGSSCPTESAPADLRVTLDGSNAGSSDGLVLGRVSDTIASDGSTIRGLNIVHFGQSGIRVPDTDNHTIACNQIGVTGDGLPAGNNTGISLGVGDGDSSAGNTMIGGPVAADRNVIGSNNASGVFLALLTLSTVIEGNYIGVGIDGTTPRGNGGNGVTDRGFGLNVIANTIATNGGFGYTTDGDVGLRRMDIINNVVGLDVNGATAGNGAGGIYVAYVDDDPSFPAEIRGNTVGANGGDGITVIDAPAEIVDNNVGVGADGTTPRGNDGHGVFVAAQGASISLNVIGDNSGNGILIHGDDVVITGNSIGVTASGNAPLGNGLSGINIQGGNAQIGGSGIASGNTIGDNGKDGITLIGSSAIGASVTGNRIGVGQNGTAQLGNAEDGVSIELGARDNRIGGPTVENTIAFNGANGINVQSDTSIDNNLRDNIIYENGALGIDLRRTGDPVGEPNPNDVPDDDSGPNNLQNYLELTSAEANGRLQGVLNTNDGLVQIDIYQVETCDASGFGEGGANRVRSQLASVSGGVYAFDEIISPAPPLGAHLVALVTDANGNTSEFGNCVPVIEATFVVNSDGIAGDANPGDGICAGGPFDDCTLRAAIDEVNALGGGPYLIRFNFGPFGQVRTIAPTDTSLIPTITAPVIIDASTLQNAACPSADGPADHRLILDGSAVTSGNGLVFGATADGSTLRGLRIRNFPGDGVRVAADDSVIACNTFDNNNRGVNVNGNDNLIGGTARPERNVIINSDDTGVRLGNTATRNKVQGNYIGVAGDGVTAAGNGGSGVFLSGGGTNRVGGSAGFAANVIAANGLHGIRLDPGDGGNQIWGNLIGLDASGATALGNGGSGIYIDNAGANEIGGDSNAKRNVIAASGGNGIFINSNGNIVQRNYVGTDSGGTVDLGNTLMGIRIIDGDSNTIGGDRAADGNLIAGNNDSGIFIDGSAVATTIRHNDIGVDANGGPLGNTLNGVHLTGFVSQAEVRDNVIAHNGRDGIAVFESVILSNFATNAIYANGELGIDLNNDGVVNLNDDGDGDGGANGLMNFPVILGADADSNIVTIFLNSLAPRDYRIHVYRNVACDATGHGEGEQFIGSFDVATLPGNPNVQESAELPFNFNAGDFLTATATPLTSPITDGTSEFSACFEATAVTGDIVYLSPDAAGTTGDGVNYEPGDILAYDTARSEFSLYFDGSAYGHGADNVDAFHILDNGNIALSYDAAVDFGAGVGVAQPQDLVLFNAGSGAFILAFDGSDVDLSTTSENVDALAALPNGDVVFNLAGAYSAGGLSGDQGDILLLDNPVWGPATGGTWQLYFDAPGSTPIDGLWFETAAAAYVSFSGPFQGFDDNDIVRCVGLACEAPFFDGDAAGLNAGVDALQIAFVTAQPPQWDAPPFMPR